MKKKVLSLTLALVMCLGLLPMTALAASGSYPEWSRSPVKFSNVVSEETVKSAEAEGGETKLFTIRPGTQISHGVPYSGFSIYHAFQDNGFYSRAWWDTDAVARTNGDPIKIDESYSGLYVVIFLLEDGFESSAFSG